MVLTRTFNDRQYPEAITRRNDPNEHFIIVYDKAVKKEDQIEGLVDFLQSEYECLLETQGRFILEEGFFKEKGFKPVIFSNNTEKRVRMFIGDQDVDFWHFALKPLPFSYLGVCMKYGVLPSKTIVMGDQLLTDILGANLSGCYGIYCKQLQEKDTPMTSRNRKIEKLIWRYLLHEEV